MTAGYAINGNENKIKIRTILQKYKNKEYRETPLMDQLSEVFKVVAEGYENDIFKAQLLVIYDVLMKKE